MTDVVESVTHEQNVELELKEMNVNLQRVIYLLEVISSSEIGSTNEIIEDL